jgi:hypothetical protein
MRGRRALVFGFEIPILSIVCIGKEFKRWAGLEIDLANSALRNT